MVRKQDHYCNTIIVLQAAWCMYVAAVYSVAEKSSHDFMRENLCGSLYAENSVTSRSE